MLPTQIMREQRNLISIWHCFKWGLPCPDFTQAVSSYLTFSPLPIIGGIFSVALAVGSRPPVVNWHSAL
tara:strand:+ start:393 stop:599 length:207 start_codon:yes stop_codon:yes gene_type:complete